MKQISFLFGGVMKEIEKYIGYYLLVYLVVLAICGFFQYMSVCQGKSLFCAFSMDGINTIITTTAYVLTPIVAIIGFQSWKNQFNSKTISEIAKDCSKLLNETNNKYCSLINSLPIHQNNEIDSCSLNDLQRLLEVCENNKVLTIINIQKLSRLTNNSDLSEKLDKWSNKCSAYTTDIMKSKLPNNDHQLNQLNERMCMIRSFGKYIITYENLDKLSLKSKHVFFFELV